jgi:hypothetical protein
MFQNRYWAQPDRASSVEAIIGMLGEEDEQELTLSKIWYFQTLVTITTHFKVERLDPTIWCTLFLYRHGIPWRC